ncbi:hypothetical protein ACFSTH_18680 [Paenibacillus yanchengensis]|uniref:Chemotaxis methyl-accepting receptor HlyB-like 4HB MCP domain-containing protein n=1 Tax=Paenibacillus yanchengensis TaxID=2035833 RepID=A0ABW4YLQ3_9BACL
MGKITLMYQKVLIIFLALGLVASLVVNLCLYNSRNGKLVNFSHQQYHKVLSDYESIILSTSHSILSKLENSIAKKEISREEILFLYMSYEELNENQIQYANYVQSYSSPEGKKAISLEQNESITLNYVPGFVYFNSSITMFKELLLQSNSNSEIAVTNDLEKRLKLAIEIIELNTAIYEKFVNEGFVPLSNETILTRLKLQKDLTASFAKLTELSIELSRLD